MRLLLASLAAGLLAPAGLFAQLSCPVTATGQEFGWGTLATIANVPTGGTAPYTWQLLPGGNLPTGAVVQTVSNRPRLNYISTASGTYNGTVRCTDATGATVDTPFSFSIPSFDFVADPSITAFAGEAYDSRIRATHPLTVFSLSPSSSPLPAGLTINSDGTFSGTFSSVSIPTTYTYTVRATIPGGIFRDRTFGVTVYPIRITNSIPARTLPVATVGQFYSYQLSATGLNPPFTYTFAGGPANGISISSTGLISGTPTSRNENLNFTVTVRDASNNQVSRRYNLPCLNATGTVLPSFATTTLSDATISQFYQATIYVTGGTPPYTYDLAPGSSLPFGAFLLNPVETHDQNDASPALLRANFKDPGTYSFTVRVTDSLGNRFSRPMQVRVVNLGSLATPATATYGAPYASNLLLLGGQPPYSVTTSAIPAGLTLSNTGILSGTPQETGSRGLTFTVVDAGGQRATFSTTVNIISSPVTIACGLATNGIPAVGQFYGWYFTCSGSPLSTPNYTLSLQSGSLPPGMVLLPRDQVTVAPFAGNVITAGGVVGTPTTAGSYTALLKMTDANNNSGYQQIVFTVSQSTIVTTAFPQGSVNVPYSFQVERRGPTANTTCNVATGALPTGLTLNPSTCLVSGTPTSTGTFAFTLQISDSAGNALSSNGLNYTINIFGLAITSAKLLPVADFTQPYTTTLTTNATGPVQWSTTLGSFTGITLDPATGVLSATRIATSGNLQITVTARSGADFVTETLILPIRTSSWYFSGATQQRLSDTAIGARYSQRLSLFGGSPPYTISLAPGSSLPAGLVVDDEFNYNSSSSPVRGINFGIFGAASTPGSYAFTIRYSDSNGMSFDRQHTISVSPLSAAVVSLPNAVLGQPYSVQLATTGGTGPATYSLVPSTNASNPEPFSLPSGLTLSSSGLISGTPLVTGGGNFNPTIDVTVGGVTRRFTIGLNVFGTTNSRRITFVKNIFVNFNEFQVGTGSTPQYSALGNSGATTYTLLSGSYPPGKTFTTPVSSAILLTGLFSATGSYLPRIQVNDATGNVGATEIPVNVTQLRFGPINTPVLNGLTLPVARINNSYSFQFTGLGGRAPYSFSLLPGYDPLPAGVTLTSSGLLSGTPTEAGPFPFGLLLTDADGKTARLVQSLIVLTPGISPSPFPTFFSQRTLVLGEPSSRALNDFLLPGYSTAAPFTWTVDSGTLPPGISIVPGSAGSSAQLAGTPTTLGTYSFVLRVTDANGRFGTTIATLIVSTGTLSPVVEQLPSAVVGTPYSQVFTPGGPAGPYTLALSAISDLPPGLALAPNGTLSGTPTLEGFYRLTFLVTDAANNIANYSYRLAIQPAGTPVSSLSATPQSISSTYVLGAPTPTPIPISLSASAGTLAYTATTSGGTWLSLTTPTGSTPGSVSLQLNPAGLPVGTYNGAVTLNAPAASNSPIVIPVSLQVVSGVSCTYSLVTYQPNLSSNAQSAPFNINTNSPSCTWSVASSSPWLTLRTPQAGSGSTGLYFDVAENTGATRTAQITGGGATLTITQFGTACDFNISPTTFIAASAGGTSQFAVSASRSNCSWTPVISDSWVTPQFPGPYGGSIQANFTIAPNPSTTSRSATFTVGTAVLTINQVGTGCTFGLSTNSASVSSAGGTVGFSLSTGPACAWNLSPGPSWLEYTGPLSGVGPVSFSLTAAASSSLTSRSGSLTVMGQPFTVTQAGLPCSYSLNDSNPVFSSTGGSALGSIGISTTGGVCNWTADSSAPWLTPTVNSGSGNSTLTFSLAANPDSASRTAKLIIAGQQVNISQAGTACSFQLLSSSATAPYSASSSFVRVLTANGCTFPAVSNASWIQLSSGTWSGSSNVTFSVSPNTLSTERSGTLTIAGQTFSVTQAAQPCVVTLSSSSSAPSQFGGSGTFGFTTSTPDCNPAVQSFSSWITIQPGSFSNGVGTVNYTIDANSFAAARVGQIKVGNAVHTITQAASTCGYSSTPTLLSFSKTGGDAAINITANQTQCAAPAPILNAPPGMVSLLNVTSPAAGSFIQNLTVSQYLSLVNAIRSAQLTIGGQIINIKQRSW